MMHSPTSMSPMARETHKPPGQALRGPYPGSSGSAAPSIYMLQVARHVIDVDTCDLKQSPSEMCRLLLLQRYMLLQLSFVH